MFTREKIPKHHRLLSTMAMRRNMSRTSLYGSSHLREIFVLDIQNNFNTDIYNPIDLIEKLNELTLANCKPIRDKFIELIDGGITFDSYFMYSDNQSIKETLESFSILLSPFISKNTILLLKDMYNSLMLSLKKMLDEKDNKKKQTQKEEISNYVLEFIKTAIYYEGKDNDSEINKNYLLMEKYYDYLLNNPFLSRLSYILDFNHKEMEDSYGEMSYMTEVQLITIIKTDKHIVLSGSEDIDELVQIAESVKRKYPKYRKVDIIKEIIDSTDDREMNEFSLKVVSLIRHIYTSYIPMETILESEDNPNILILPKDFRFQRGTTFKRGEPDRRNNVYDDFNDTHKKFAHFATSIMTTLDYTTIKEDEDTAVTSQQYCDTIGEIQVFKTRHDLRLLNLSNVQNVKYLRVKLAEMGAPQEVIDAFENGWIISKKDGVEKLKRNSGYTGDYLVVNWLCENGFNGYLATHISRFHDEIMICDPSKNLKYMLKHTSEDFNIPICEEPYNEFEIVMIYASP